MGRGESRMGEYFSNSNGINLYERARERGGEILGRELERKSICGKGMFNDQIGLKLSGNQPLSFCYKYGGGEIVLLPDGRLFLSEGHREKLTEEYMAMDIEEIFEAPMEKVETPQKVTV